MNLKNTPTALRCHQRSRFQSQSATVGVLNRALRYWEEPYGKSQGFTYYQACQVKPIFSDLYVPEIPLLAEAKGILERGSTRMALGQLLDYRRFVRRARCAALVPSKPGSDIVELVRSAGMEQYWPENAGFNALL